MRATQSLGWKMKVSSLMSHPPLSPLFEKGLLLLLGCFIKINDIAPATLLPLLWWMAPLLMVWASHVFKMHIGGVDGKPFLRSNIAIYLYIVL